MSERISRRKMLKNSSALGIAATASQVSADEAPNKSDQLVTVRPRTEATQQWLMPAHFGSPAWQHPPHPAEGDSVYGDVTRISMSYRTDERNLTRLLPHPYELDGPPTIVPDEIP